MTIPNQSVRIRDLERLQTPEDIAAKQEVLIPVASNGQVKESYSVPINTLAAWLLLNYAADKDLSNLTETGQSIIDHKQDYFFDNPVDSDLNTFTKDGIWKVEVTGAVECHTPNNLTGYFIISVDTADENTIEQQARELHTSPGNVYRRQRVNGTWGAWSMITQDMSNPIFINSPTVVNPGTADNQLSTIGQLNSKFADVFKTQLYITEGLLITGLPSYSGGTLTIPAGSKYITNTSIETVVGTDITGTVPTSGRSFVFVDESQTIKTFTNFQKVMDVPETMESGTLYYIITSNTYQDTNDIYQLAPIGIVDDGVFTQSDSIQLMNIDSLIAALGTLGIEDKVDQMVGDLAQNSQVSSDLEYSRTISAGAYDISNPEEPVMTSGARVSVQNKELSEDGSTLSNNPQFLAAATDGTNTSEMIIKPNLATLKVPRLTVPSDIATLFDLDESNTNKADKTTDFQTPITGANKGATMAEIEQVRTATIKFTGYVSTSAPSASSYTLMEGNLWINSATMPTSFPVPSSSIQQWNGTAWVAYSQSYTPAAFDAWSNLNNNEGYYFFGGVWKVFSTDLSTEYFTLNQTSGLWEIAPSIELPGTPTVATPSGSNPQAIVNVDYVNSGITIGNKIANCVLQVPQNLNITFENGTVTLKAGSTVYVPNGTETFNAINIESDVSVSSVQGGASGEITIYYNPNDNRLKTYSSSADDSGTSDPSSGTFYNTADNLIKRIEGGSIVYSGLSFPIAHVTASSGTITSLDEVFNGYGYIGFVVFTLPGMQYAIPNGRNSDGTLNNNTTIQTVVRTATVTSTSRTELYTSYLGLAAVAPGTYTYSYADNMLMASDGSTRNYIFFGTLSMSSTQITGMNPKYPIQVTDYWDFNKLVKEVDNAINDLESSKQNKLTAGANISISGDTISATGIGLLEDLSNVTQTGKDSVMTWGIPDYSAGISGAWGGTVNTITQPSCVQIEFYAYADAPITITINGQSHNLQTNDAARYRMFYWLDANDTIACGGGLNNQSITIFPLKGVANA